MHLGSITHRWLYQNIPPNPVLIVSAPYIKMHGGNLHEPEFQLMFYVFLFGSPNLHPKPSKLNFTSRSIAMYALYPTRTRIHEVVKPKPFFVDVHGNRAISLFTSSVICMKPGKETLSKDMAHIYVNTSFHQFQLCSQRTCTPNRHHGTHPCKSVHITTYPPTLQPKPPAKCSNTNLDSIQQRQEVALRPRQVGYKRHLDLV